MAESAGTSGRRPSTLALDDYEAHQRKTLTDTETDIRLVTLWYQRQNVIFASQDKWVINTRSFDINQNRFVTIFIINTNK